MRKISIFRIIALFLFCGTLSSLSALEDTAFISFTANLVANFGFSEGPVTGPIYPSDELTEGETISFSEYQEGTNSLSTPLRYIYWQIFTDENVTLSVKWTDLVGNDNNTSVQWNDLRQHLTAANKEQVLYSRSNGSSNKIDSLAFQLSVDNVNSIDWDKEPYTGTITLIFESEGA